jgi:hypothetical protein
VTIRLPSLSVNTFGATGRRERTLEVSGSGIARDVAGEAGTGRLLGSTPLDIL